VRTFASASSIIFGRFLCAVWLLAGSTLATAQNAPKTRTREPDSAPAGKTADTGPANAPKEGRKNLGLSQISIIDKFMGAEYALGPLLKRTNEEQWKDEYEALYKEFARDANPGNLPANRSILALALGIKASDGVLALKARNMEALNTCAEQIEKLATRLNVPAKNLQRAAIIKHHALARRWVDAFMELGFLQREVSRTLEGKIIEDTEVARTQVSEAFLIVVGSWLEGGRCITSLIAKNHTTESSNILREPMLIGMMIKEMSMLPESHKADPVVQEIMKFLPEVQKSVNVGPRDPIPLETVKQMHERFSQLIELVLKPAPVKR